MEETFHKILIVQTAFIGDVILTLPLVQVLHKSFPSSAIDVVVVPGAAEICAHHPAIANIIPYDKRGKDKGVRGFRRFFAHLSTIHYDLILVPHRSIRSALLTWLLHPRVSIGFNKSEGRWLFKKIVQYISTIHEIERNLSLLNPLGINTDNRELPHVYPSTEDRFIVDSILSNAKVNQNKTLVAVAPGTIWNTKRWPAEQFAEVCKRLSSMSQVLLLGGKEDAALCDSISGATNSSQVMNLAGKLSLLQSAEIIRRCKVLLSNDSAPMHMAVAVGTPVVAIFGATIPEFGFAPRGPQDRVIETKGLKCRPCAIHGGNLCPIHTFECMLSITPETVFAEVHKIAASSFLDDSYK